MLPREVLLDRFHLRSWDRANLSFACKKHYALSTNSFQSSYRRALTPAERWDETLILLPPIYHTIPDQNVRILKELSHVHLSVLFPPAPAFAIVAAPAFASSKGSGGLERVKLLVMPARQWKSNRSYDPFKDVSIYIFFCRRKKTVKQGRRSKESLMLGASTPSSIQSDVSRRRQSPILPHNIYGFIIPRLVRFLFFFLRALFFDQCRITLFY